MSDAQRNLCGISGPVLQRTWECGGTPDGDVYEEWHSGHTGVHLCGPRGGVPDALSGLPRYAFQLVDLQHGYEFQTRLESDALTWVPGVPVDEESILPTADPPNPGENILRAVLVGSVWFTLGTTLRSVMQLVDSFDEAASPWPPWLGRPMVAPPCQGWRESRTITIFEHFLSMLILLGPVPVPSKMPWAQCARTLHWTFLFRAKDYGRWLLLELARGDRDPGIDEHPLLWELLGYATCYDQLTCAFLAFAEAVARRLQLWKERYAEKLRVTTNGSARAWTCQ